MEAQRITLALVDSSAGYEARPDRVRLGDLARFADDVQTFLRGNGREVDTQQLEVAIRDGSLAIETAPLPAAPKLFQDLQALLTGELLDGLDARRKEVVERWQKAARKSRALAYRISAPFLSQPVVVSAQTDYRADDADQWVQVERYIRGEIQDLGGANKVNAHVRLPDGSTLTVSTEKDLLRDDKVNRLYKTAMLRVKAEYNVLTRELRNARLLAFVEYASTVDEEQLARLAQRGAAAWKDVADPVAWVDELRGGES
ncbi:hypothetical protein LRH25_03380 [Ideonella azotifigens]|uniref:Uncharacterized protein n=1 Tax=Ideonella azotifigens TaxID=513160 RepID=A0ABN1KK37_9BURK|nr:hypothetical protein [Ideonella azotifigens]MCD2339377.1 hypothetical protein [Ideonella azotifigens]